MVTITPEIQAQLDAAKKQCPFCKIIAGEIPGTEVFSDDKVHAVMDINPWMKGHVLLMPKEHYPIMPYLPPDLFKHMFGLLPKFIEAVKKGMVTTGANIVIANGGVAGQQSPHFLMHVLPREKGDGFNKYGFEEEKSLDQEKLKKANQMLAQNLPIMMRNHFQRNPAKWRQKQFSGNVYEDEKVVCSVPEHPQCIGHLKIVPKGFKEFEEMDPESSAHLFFTASYCATAVFEGLGAHGSNIILKTGASDDNSGISVHVLPRYQDDGMDVIGKPMSNKPDLKDIAGRIKDHTYIINMKEEKKDEVLDLDKQKEKQEDKLKKVDPNSAEGEISSAIEAIRKQ